MSKIETQLEINGKTYAGKDLSLILLGMSLKEESIIKLLRHEYLEMDNLEYEHFSNTCITCDNIALIKGEK